MVAGKLFFVFNEKAKCSYCGVEEDVIFVPAEEGENREKVREEVKEGKRICFCEFCFRFD